MAAKDQNELAKQFSVSLPIAALLVAFGELFAAGVLSAGHFLKLPVPCGSSSGCVAVSSDPSSRFAGIPIAFFGVGAYIAILFLLTLLDRARWARLALVALTGVGTILSARLLVRELQNRIKRAVIMADSKRITEKDLELSSGIGISSSTTLKEARESVEREMVQRALKRNMGRISSAATELGISRPTLYELMEKLGISRK